MTKPKPTKVIVEKLPEEIEVRVKNSINTLEETMLEAKGVIKKLDVALSRAVRGIGTMIRKVDKTVSTFDKKMDENTAIIVEAEETLRNVLLAIRQNEYLQAWYPEQMGYPEMYVTGKHPSKYDKNRHQPPKE